MTSDHVGQLLAEYLRVINDKDNQIQKLIKGMEDLRVSHKRNDDQFKSKIKKLKSEIQEKITAYIQLKDRITENEVVISNLLSMNETLKSDLQAKDKELQAISSKLSSAYDKLQRDAEEHVEVIAKLRNRLEECDIKLKEADTKQERLEREANTYLATASELQNKVQLSEDNIRELNGTVTLLRKQLEDSIPRQEHEYRVGQLETKCEENATKHKCSTEELEQKLHAMKEEIDRLTRALNERQQSLQEAITQRESSDKMVCELRQKKQELEHVVETASQDVQSWKETSRKATDTQTEMSRTIASKEDQLRQAMETLQETRIMFERLKVQAEATERSLQAQLEVTNEKVKHHSEEVECYRRQLEDRESALHAATTALSTLKDNTTLTSSTLRDQVTTSNASVSAYKEENERLRHELKQAQLKQQETQHAISQEVTALRVKIEEHQAATQTNWQRLRDKEEEIRRLELIHDKALKEQKYEHASAMEALCRNKDAEIQNALSRLERSQAELLDHIGAKKSLSQDLERYAEHTRQLKSELVCLQSSLASKEETIAALKTNLEDANSKIFNQEQCHVAQRQEEAQHRLRMEAVERDRDAVKSALIRAEAAVAERDSIVRKLEDSIAKVQSHEQAQEARIQILDRQIAEQQEAEKHSRRELALREIEIDKLHHRMEQAEAQAMEGQTALKKAHQHTEAAQNALKTAQDEVLRLHGELESRSAEFKRTAEHAKEIEELARKKSEEFQQALESRDETIATLQRERATILPHLNEEQSKNLVLQEKLQHHRELEQLTVSGLQEHISELEMGLHNKEAEAKMAKELSTDARQRLEELQAELQSHQETLKLIEKKYFASKEELRKVLVALEKEKASANSWAERLESEVSSTNALRRKFKKEKNRMEVLIKQLEEKVNLASSVEKASQQRESALLKDLQVAEAALRASKTQNRETFDSQKGFYKDTIENAAALKQKCADLQLQVTAAQDDAASARNACNELRRRLACSNISSRSAEYAEEAITMKLILSDLMTAFYRETVQLMKRHLHSSWIICQRLKHEHELRAREQAERMILELEKTKAEHDFAMDEALNRHRKEIAQLREGHRAELAESRQTAAEGAFECRREKEMSACALQEKDAALHSATVELECAKVEIAHLRKQLQAVQAQRDAAELRGVALERDLEDARRQREAVERRLRDSAAGRRARADEARELRAELTALQRLLTQHKDGAAAGRAELLEASARLRRAEEAREEAVAQLRALQQQVDGARGRLEGVQEGHTRALADLQRAHAADTARLERLQARLDAANHELQRLQQYLAGQNHKMASLAEKLQRARDAETAALSRDQALNSEISTLHEQCANLESLKHISETALAEAELREQGLLSKLEELRSSQELMQVCFDKQQEQLEVWRRLREQGAE